MKDQSWLDAEVQTAPRTTTSTTLSTASWARPLPARPWKATACRQVYRLPRRRRHPLHRVPPCTTINRWCNRPIWAPCHPITMLTSTIRVTCTPLSTAASSLRRRLHHRPLHPRTAHPSTTWAAISDIRYTSDRPRTAPWCPATAPVTSTRKIILWLRFPDPCLVPAARWCCPRVDFSNSRCPFSIPHSPRSKTWAGRWWTSPTTVSCPRVPQRTTMTLWAVTTIQSFPEVVEAEAARTVRLETVATRGAEEGMAREVKDRGQPVDRPSTPLMFRSIRGWKGSIPPIVSRDVSWYINSQVLLITMPVI